MFVDQSSAWKLGDKTFSKKDEVSDSLNNSLGPMWSLQQIQDDHQLNTAHSWLLRDFTTSAPAKMILVNKLLNKRRYEQSSIVASHHFQMRLRNLSDDDQIEVYLWKQVVSNPRHFHSSATIGPFRLRTMQTKCSLLLIMAKELAWFWFFLWQQWTHQDHRLLPHRQLHPYPSKHPYPWISQSEHPETWWSLSVASRQVLHHSGKCLSVFPLSSTAFSLVQPCRIFLENTWLLTTAELL